MAEETQGIRAAGKRPPSKKDRTRKAEEIARAEEWTPRRSHHLR
jgi:hypothetical protein